MNLESMIVIPAKLLAEVKDVLSNYQFYEICDSEGNCEDSHSNDEVIDALKKLDSYLESVGIEL